MAVGQVPGFNAQVVIDVGRDLVSHELVLGDCKGDDAGWVGDGIVLSVEAVRADFA